MVSVEPPAETGTVRAAGGVVHRVVDGEPCVAVVHRSRYDDWSLPKGKLGTGAGPDRETDLAAAVREVGEETGLSVVVRRRLAPVRYPAAGRAKSVQYFTMLPTGGGFEANDETDELQWWSADRAAGDLTYDGDRDAVREAFALPAHDAVVLLVRHARAGKRSQWKGSDADRPLDREGRRQARGLIGFARAFGAQRVASAPLVRCRQTVEPVAQALGVEILDAPEVTDSAEAKQPLAALATLRSFATPATVTVVCSQGGAIPDLLERLHVAGDRPSRKGSAWALFLAGDAVVGADYYPRPAGRRARD